MAHSGEARLRSTHAHAGEQAPMSDESHPPTSPLVVLFVMGIVLVAMWLGLSGVLEGMENSHDVEIACIGPSDDPGC